MLVPGKKAPSDSQANIDEHSYQNLDGKAIDSSSADAHVIRYQADNRIHRYANNDKESETPPNMREPELTVHQQQLRSQPLSGCIALGGGGGLADGNPK